MMDTFKKGLVCWYVDAFDHTTTKAKLVSVCTDDERFVKVRWLEPRWNLKENILLNRRGTTSEILFDRLQTHP